MKMVLEKDIVSLTDFARQTRKHTAELKKHNRPRVLTHNGKATAVVMSVAAYEELLNAAEEYRLDMELKAALEAYDRGDRGTPSVVAFERIRRKARLRQERKMSFAWSLADTAEVDIDRQMIWYESDDSHGGAGLANRWNDCLELALEKLALSPHRHGFAPENGKWMQQYKVRQMLFRPWKSGTGWRVLYTIDEASKLVTILQIRHEHRRWLFETVDDDSQST